MPLLRRLESQVDVGSLKLNQVGSVINDEKLPAAQGKLAQELLKSNYDLGFVCLPEGYDEEVLENIIEQRMTRFLLELGEGLAFCRKTKRNDNCRQDKKDRFVILGG